jgi:large subunit ribosomal protein L6
MMSRIGKKPVALPKGVTATVEGKTVKVKGPKGELKVTLVPEVDASVGDDGVTLTPHLEMEGADAMWGMSRTLVNNLVVGVTAGFTSKLEIQGVGYRAALRGSSIELLLGFSHPVVVEPPEGIEFEIPAPTQIIVRGIDKQSVGQVAADIRRLRPPEPYKGKGIRYTGEVVRRKVGKRA